MSTLYQREAERRRKFWEDTAYKGKTDDVAKKAKPVKPRIHNFPKDQKLRTSTIEQSKRVLVKVKHPSVGARKRTDTEYRVSLVPWSRGHYIDVRQYYKGEHPTRYGFFMHQDILAKLLPAIIYALRIAEQRDTREPEQKANPEVIETFDEA